MFTGRKKELQKLQEYYQNKEINILVVYGQRGIGKTTLLERFVEEKNNIYYEAVSCSLREQKKFFISRLGNMGELSQSSSFEEILNFMEDSGKDRLILIIDEFQNMCKTETEFLESLKAYQENKNSKKKLFIILCSSAICWVENIFRNKEEYGNDFCELFKVKELSYYDFSSYFSKFDKMDRIGGFSILGGVPGLWKYFDDEFSLRENVEKFVLNRNQPLFYYGQQYISEELRECCVYNTILSALAKGNEKLNDIYRYTGFSRAKISVYLKNLIQLDLVEKISSIDTKGKSDTKKGSYRISHSYVHFYYRYLFSNLNRLFTDKPDVFYDEVIRVDFSFYVKDGFKKICREFIEMENKRGRLPGNFTYLGEWNGKSGSIDFIFLEEEEEILAGICSWEKEMMTYDQYETFVSCQEKAKIEVDFTILFSYSKFDNHLKEEAKKNPRLALLSIDQMG